MTRRRPRCILLTGHRRCHRRAATGMGDLYTCSGHGRITLLVMEDSTSPQTRRLLAYSRWETAAEGRRLINRKLGRRVA
jgi:hypothetical protein